MKFEILFVMLHSVLARGATCIDVSDQQHDEMDAVRPSWLRVPRRSPSQFDAGY
jgi:hypothetical protein